MKGYKAFNEDLTCRYYQFEIGKEYTHDGEIAVCKSGFHFCKSLADCYQFYPMEESTRICKIEAIGDIITNDNIKYCTNKIKILSEVKKPRVKSNSSESSSGYCNSGNNNTGNHNSGHRNSGNWNSNNQNSGNYNSGYRNSGDRNSGDYNSGDQNSGDRNSGYQNSGDRNSGYSNSGYQNSGDWNSGDNNSGSYNSGDWNSGQQNSGNYNSGYQNSGDWNSGDNNSGVFNSITPTINMFNKATDWTYETWFKSRARFIMLDCPHTYLTYVPISEMTDEEKENHPECKTTGDYLKTIVVKQEDKQKWWDELNDEDKQVIYDLPNFDPVIFKECTGIDVSGGAT